MAALFFLVWWKEALVELVSGVGDGHQGGDAHGHIPRGKHPNSLALPQSGAPNPSTQPSTRTIFAGKQAEEKMLLAKKEKRTGNNPTGPHGSSAA